MADILQLFNEPLHGDKSDSDSDIDYGYANHDLAAGNLKVDKEDVIENSVCTLNNLSVEKIYELGILGGDEIDAGLLISHLILNATTKLY